MQLVSGSSLQAAPRDGHQRGTVAAAALSGTSSPASIDLKKEKTESLLSGWTRELQFCLFWKNAFLQVKDS